MNPLDLFNQVKDLIEKKDLDGAKNFIDQHKDELGDYLHQAQDLLKGAKGLDDVLGKVKGLF